MKASNIKEADRLVSILNHIVETAGYNVDCHGFGYDQDLNISAINEGDLDDDLSEALDWVWTDLLFRVIKK